jgi:hypothetical protein
MKRITFIIITSLFIMLNLSHADYHYVSHTGSDEYPYSSWETAADSIRKAVDASDRWDTIYIASGDYNELFFAAPGDSCLSFIGMGADSTRIWSPDSIPNLWVVEGKTLVQNLCFDATNPARDRACLGGYVGAEITALDCKFIGGAGIFTSAEYMVVKRCQFYNFSDMIFGYGDSVIFENNICRTNSSNGNMLECRFIRGVFANSIFTVGHTYTNMFLQEYCNQDTTYFFNNYYTRVSDGIIAAVPDSALIENNTARDILYGNTSGGEGIFIYDSDTPVRAQISNNVFDHCNYGVRENLSNPESHVLVSYNCFWNNAWGNIYSDFQHLDTTANIQAFPMFVNPDSDDVHLQAYSPLIDAGDPSILDVDGTRSDIGCLGGPGGTSYSYRDLPPRIPDSLSYEISGDSLIISWRQNHESDFFRYMVNRDTIAGFTPQAINIVSEPESSLFVDFNWDRFHDYFYRIAAYDNQGNLSPYSLELAVYLTGINESGGAEMPNITGLESNYPNPFNSSTTLIYTVANLGPIPAQINIDIYDVGGRKVRTLLDGREDVGRHTIVWDGKDDSGHDLASGIYLARITQWNESGLSKNLKLVLVR